MWTAETIRGLRDARLETQVEFAAKVGVHPKTVSDWELGHSVPQRRFLRRLNALAKG